MPAPHFWACTAQKSVRDQIYCEMKRGERGTGKEEEGGGGTGREEKGGEGGEGREGRRRDLDISVIRNLPFLVFLSCK